ncbi:MAG: hypothetical protein PHR75_04615 [Sulfurovum sp.]|nr:hypothetical protein [Sulfurovum sp.]MDD3602565.1 hypothetical protein [Sulfurovum sp.]
MKHLRGYTRRYFSLAIIAMYSTLHKLCRVESSYQYHKLAYENQEHKTSPPCDSLSLSLS